MKEGGGLVPFFVNGRGVTVAGKVNPNVADASDLLPTFAEVAGVPVPTPGDESANGVWKLRIEDSSSSGGAVLSWDLEVSTRFD